MRGEEILNAKDAKYARRGRKEADLCALGVFLCASFAFNHPFIDMPLDLCLNRQGKQCRVNELLPEDSHDWKLQHGLVVLASNVLLSYL